MYLRKINEKWSAYAKACGIEVSVRITNTTKLSGCKGMYMAEFLHAGLRYHLYHELGQADYELRIVDESYAVTSFEASFGCEDGQAILRLINAFMQNNYGGIHTSVDCSSGLAKAKLDIYRVRFAGGGSPSSALNQQ
ncbi:hypothetical protein [Paenibacillus sp. BC26]|uniref:hypothetical protein n=1 Tax=Paenibacillus sp. BC26 TaxID=1881032 RepID=UPI0008EA7400|nr:hypothetical protein [Paenibacillus sp. BC26]SFS61808.1 hypothetical protein SAMN05428962_1534 [Paenibacillus sp. BC26]